MKLKRRYTGVTLSVRLSICGQNHAHSLSSAILVGSIPYLHILSSNFRRCVACKVCYASAFRRRRHYVFGLSVRPSVRSLKYPLLTCTWVRWSTWPTVTVLRHVRPSVRPSIRLSVCPSVRPSVRRGFRAFAGERMEGLAWNFTCWCILTIFRTD